MTQLSIVNHAVVLLGPSKEECMIINSSTLKVYAHSIANHVPFHNSRGRFS